MPAAIDITGQKWSRLVAIEKVGSNKHQHAMWLFKCDCGNTKIIEAEKVKRKKDAIRSCGCSKAHHKKGIDVVINQVYSGNGYSDGDLSFEDFKRLSQQDCYYCGAKPNNKCTKKNGRKRQVIGLTWIYNGLNRLNHGKAHDLDNVVPCCWPCNQRISNTNHQDYMEYIKKVYEINEKRRQEECLSSVF